MTLGATLACAAALTGLPGEALAACDPAAANDVTATCTGTTVNQGGGAPGTSAGEDGYGTGAETNVNVTVESGASVTGTDPIFGKGIFVSSGTVTNAGTITGGGGSAQAHGVSGATTVINSGTITGSNGHGVDGGTTHGVTVINSGTIQANGGGKGVAGIGGDANVTNSGSIVGAAGVEFFDNVTVSNSGTIMGTAGNGVSSLSGNVIVTSNTGTIKGTLHGISGGTANVTNSGTVMGGTNGIRAFLGAANVTNSGTISGGTNALSFSSAADTLTILPGSTLIGALHLGGGADTINLRTGNQNLTFDASLAGDTINSTVPFVISGNTIVTVDPTPFAATNGTTIDVTGAISNVVASRLDEIGGGSAALPALADHPADSAEARRNGAVASFGDAAAALPSSVTAQYSGGAMVWGRGFGGWRHQEASGSMLENSTAYYGGLFGIDAPMGADMRLGAFFGGGATDTDYTPSISDASSEMVFGGVLARRDFGASFISAAVQGGVSWNDTSRTINNNLAAGGTETASGSYSGWYLSPEATIGHAFTMPSAGATFSIVPSVTLRYLHAEYDGYTETGSTANMTVGGRSQDVFEQRGQVKFAASGKSLSGSLHGGVLGQEQFGDDTVNVTVLGQTLAVSTSSDTVWGGFGGAGLAYRMGRATLSTNAEYTRYSDDTDVISVHGGVHVAF